MLKVLIPVDGSGNSARTAQYVIDNAPKFKAPLEIHLLNVQRPFPGTIKGVNGNEYVNDLAAGNLAAAFAWINCFGNLGGTVGPYYVGYMKDLTGNFAGGLYGLALLALVAALVCAFGLHLPAQGPQQAKAQLAE